MDVQYAAVTADKYELPLAVADSVPELARMTGRSEGTIYACISHGRSGKNTGMKFIRIVHSAPKPVIDAP